MLLPFLKDLLSAVSQEMALPHWLCRIWKLSGVTPTPARNSSMNLQREGEGEGEREEEGEGEVAVIHSIRTAYILTKQKISVK